MLNGIIPRSELNITDGSPREVNWKIGKSTMCGDCGTHLWAVADIVPDFALFRIGTLDDTSWVNPVAHIWTDSAQPWIRFNEHARKYPAQPENPMKLLEAVSKLSEVLPGVILSQFKARAACLTGCQRAVSNAEMRQNGPGPSGWVLKLALAALPRLEMEPPFPAHGALRSPI